MYTYVLYYAAHITGLRATQACYMTGNSRQPAARSGRAALLLSAFIHAVLKHLYVTRYSLSVGICVSSCCCDELDVVVVAVTHLLAVSGSHYLRQKRTELHGYIHALCNCPCKCTVDSRECLLPRQARPPRGFRWAL
jgi:hypothetical protein